MPKSLGQIHTANFTATAQQGASYPQYHLMDTAGQLADQLQHQVRQGNIFKHVGFDLDVINASDSTHSAMVSGEILYMAPTRGRVGAYKKAFQAMMASLKLQGVNVRGNRNYDFRCMIHHPNYYTSGGIFSNVATFDGTNPLQLCGDSHSQNNDEVFDTWNRNLQPSQTAAVDFDTGFGIQGVNVEYALNQVELYDPSMVSRAATSLESIPFQATYDPTEGTSFTVEWRPDPALYLAVMAGMFEIRVDDVQTQVAGETALIKIAAHVAGWRSMMGSGKKRKSTRRSKRRGRKS